jgi:CRISPR/Cas system-associated exonuclease Cas4 (RecB family)
MITTGSYSKLTDFEKCKFYAYLKHDKKIPEPLRPLKPGQTEYANDRGTRYHTNCEEYVLGNIHELYPDIDKAFGPELDLLRVLNAEGVVSMEGEWGYDREWNVAPWKEAWVRMKLDAIVFHHVTHATVIDYKTGRKFGNEMKHAEQTRLYAIGAALRYPELEFITTELWYLDQKEVTSVTMTRKQALMFRQNYNTRFVKMTSATDFPPNPNKFSCQWCQYGPWNGGQCPDGIKK